MTTSVAPNGGGGVVIGHLGCGTTAVAAIAVALIALIALIAAVAVVAIIGVVAVVVAVIVVGVGVGVVVVVVMVLLFPSLGARTFSQKTLFLFRHLRKNNTKQNRVELNF
jgi:hypothetical protein